MRFLLLIFLVLGATSLLGQAPGGVADPLLWSRTVPNDPEAPTWRETGRLQPGWTQPVTASWSSFNDHPTAALTGAGRVAALPQQDWSRITLFSVYRSADLGRESLVWSLRTPAAHYWLLTTRRAADLHRVDYLNFGAGQVRSVGLHTYFHNFGKAASYRQPATLYWGQKPPEADLPIESFRGELPELIAYDRVLTPTERNRVESYLALKYGLTLGVGQTPTDYHAANGQLVWDSEKNADFHHDVTGLGRDASSGWIQYRSASAYDPELLRIELAEPAKEETGLTDGSFLIWGHNAAPLTPQTNERGLPPYGARHWRITARGNVSDLPSTLRIDPRQLATERAPGETYWLLIDRAGKEFGAGPIDYVPLDVLEDNRFARFRAIHWDTDGNGRDAFALAIGPPLLATVRQTPPSCAAGTAGGLTVGAIGGRAPYRYSLRAPEAAFAESWTGDGRPRHWTALPAGAYELTVADAKGGTFRTTLYLEASDAPRIELTRHYELGAEPALDLSVDPALATYTWTGPAGWRATGPRVSLSVPGDYTLLAERDGCRAWHRFVVTAPPAALFTTVALSPNPALRRQPVTLEVHSAQAVAPELTLLDAAGQVISRRQLPYGDYFRETLALPRSGTYWVRLRAAGQTTARRLIVQ